MLHTSTYQMSFVIVRQHNNMCLLRYCKAALCRRICTLQRFKCCPVTQAQAYRGMAVLKPEKMERDIDSDVDKIEASLYVHWPYCERRCSYCNFNKYIDNSVDHEKMARCLSQEAKSLIAISGVQVITSIFFGGGTPSLAIPKTFETVIDTVAREASLKTNAEVTMEANPTSAERGKLQDFRAAGINRLSLGVQSLSDKNLKLLNRDHSVKDTIECLQFAKKLFPKKCSVDVIFGLPGQSVEDLSIELGCMLELCDDHLSMYQLTLERGTSLFKQVKEGNLCVPDSELVAVMYAYAVNFLEEKGYNRYEVSNFAKSYEAESSHNKSCWHGQQYLGIGPGAHGRFIPYGEGLSERQARVQTLEPKPWMWEVEHKGHATRKAVTQSKKEILEELVTLGVRTKEGISHRRWASFNPPASLVDIFLNQEEVRGLIEAGYLMITDAGISPSKLGMNVADKLAVALISGLETFYAQENMTDVQ